MAATPEAVLARMGTGSGGSFREKLIRVTFILASKGATFPGTQSNQLVIQGLRTSAKVTTVNRQSTLSALSIWGMRMEDMNALTVAWSAPGSLTLNNSLIIEAGTRDKFSEVFRGTIFEAQPNYDSAPEVTFDAQAMGGYFAAIDVFPDTSWSGSVSIVDMARKILAGTTFNVVDGGAEGTLTNPKFTGSRWQQLGIACESTQTDWYVVGNDVVLCPFNKPKTDVPALVLSPNTGLIGYPRLERAGLVVKSLFDPALTCGTPIEIRNSIVPYANGRWFPQKVEHMLEANLPNGKWESESYCLRVGALT
jgi:hypothetical protein